MEDNIKVIGDREDLVAVADAVRSKTGTTEEMTLNEMATNIANISGGGDLSRADVVDNLLSESTDLPLSANQGRLLKADIEAMPRHIEFDLPAYGTITFEFQGFTSALITVMSTSTEAHLVCFYTGYAHAIRQKITDIIHGRAYSYSISDTEQKISITTVMEYDSACSITVFRGKMPEITIE